MATSEYYVIISAQGAAQSAAIFSQRTDWQQFNSTMPHPPLQSDQNANVSTIALLNSITELSGLINKDLYENTPTSPI